jgi:hypothetical protein
MALAFPPFERSWQRYSVYLPVMLVLVPLLHWWFERGIRIGQQKEERR